jgi:hypothetical protein
MGESDGVRISGESRNVDPTVDLYVLYFFALRERTVITTFLAT